MLQSCASQHAPPMQSASDPHSTVHFSPAQRVVDAHACGPSHTTFVFFASLRTWLGQVWSPVQATLQSTVLDLQLTSPQLLMPRQFRSHVLALHFTAFGHDVSPLQLTVHVSPAQVMPLAQLLGPAQSTSQRVARPQSMPCRHVFSALHST